MKRITELDGLRTIAISLVMASHYDAFAGALYGMPAFGWIGVDIFFVLSGFLITSILLKLRETPHPFLVFYARRTLRIFPPYFLVLISILGLATIIRPDKWHLTAGSFIMDAAFFGSIRTSYDVLGRATSSLRLHSFPCLQPHGFLPAIRTVVPEHMENTLLPLWSLSVEEWFYILWAPIALRCKRSGITALATTVIFFCVIVRWLGSGGLTWYFSFLCRIDILLLGGLLALWLDQKPRLTCRHQITGTKVIAYVSVISMLLLTALCVWIRPILGRDIRESVAFTTFGSPLIGLVIVGCLNRILDSIDSPTPISRFLRLPFMVYIGQRSYTLYLVHFPIYFVVDHVFAGFSGAHASYERWCVACLSVTLSVGVAALSWRFIEKPLLDNKEAWTGLLINRFPRAEPVALTPA